MRFRPLLAMAIAAIVLTSTLLVAGRDDGSDERREATERAKSLRVRGLSLGYNLDYNDAVAAFRQAIELDPDDPAAYRLVAAAAWTEILFRQGMVTADDYLGRARTRVDRQPAPPDLASRFHEHLNRSLELAERRLREHPKDADAHFQVGAAVACLASYMATVDGQILGGFRAARRAYLEHEHVLAIDATRHDAGLVVGTYRYGVSTLPIGWRLLARLAGFGTGRERGIRMVEDAARSGGDTQANALFSLIVIYDREHQFDQALAAIEELQRLYPRNRLLWLEAGNSALRAGRPAVARRALEDGLARLAADSRPRAFGEEARWRYAYGSALAALDAPSAERELTASLSGDAHDWVRGRTHLELARIASRSGQTARASAEARTAAGLCRTGHDDDCVEDVSMLLAGKGSR